MLKEKKINHEPLLNYSKYIKSLNNRKIIIYFIHFWHKGKGLIRKINVIVPLTILK